MESGRVSDCSELTSSSISSKKLLELQNGLLGYKCGCSYHCSFYFWPLSSITLIYFCFSTRNIFFGGGWVGGERAMIIVLWQLPFSRCLEVGVVTASSACGAKQCWVFNPGLLFAKKVPSSFQPPFNLNTFSVVESIILF